MSSFEQNGRQSPALAKVEPSSGPIRNTVKSVVRKTSTSTPSKEEADGDSDDHSSNADAGGSSSRSQVQAPVKSACTFCRSRKSRCNGKQPCAACVARGRTDDCIYTISRRGGKPKPKGEKQEPLEAHLEKLLGLSEMPHLVRIPGVIPQLQSFQDQPMASAFQPYQNVDPSQMMGMTGFSNDSGSANMGMHNQQIAHSLPMPYSNIQQQAFSPVGSSPAQMFTPQTSNRERSTSVHDLAPSTPYRVLLSEYYRLLFRFLAVLPDVQYSETIAQNLTPTSPLTLALQCVLPVTGGRSTFSIQNPSGAEGSNKDAIRAEAQYFAKKAYDVIDEALENAENQDKNDTFLLEVIQALCILVVYEYGSGRALKSRLKVDAALTLAMGRGLHRLSPAKHNAESVDALSSMGMQSMHYLRRIPDSELYETKKRIWWTLWALAMWTAYNTGRIPTVRADDPRVTCELPAAGNTQSWPRVIGSLQGLLLVQDRVLALAHIEHGRAPADGKFGQSDIPLSGELPFIGRSTPSRQVSHNGGNDDIPSNFSGQPTLSSRAAILQSMAELDNTLQEQMRLIEQTTSEIVVPASQISSNTVGKAPADDLERFLQFIWATQIYTTSLTLHIGQAFQGATLFERKLCFLSTISEANNAAACQMPMPNAFDEQNGGENGEIPMAMAPDQDLYARGPFAPRESLRRCVDASDKLLLISRNIRQTEASMISPNPFNACSFVLISFVCLMQALAISSNSPDDGPSADTALSSSGGVEWNAAFANGIPGSAGAATPSLLRSAQGAAALTPAPSYGETGDSHNVSFDATQTAQYGSGISDSRASRQEQLQRIWGRVKEAKDALQDLARFWDMAIPMSEEVSGCLEASQFLLSQQNPTTSFPV